MFNFVQNLAPKSVQSTLHRQSSRVQCPPPTSHKEGGYKIYKYLTFFIGLPAIVAVAALTFIQKKHKNECEERLPFVPYEYLRRRTKRFPWGDGAKSLFHNPIMNPLPEGYEEDSECVVGTEEDEEQED